MSADIERFEISVMLVQDKDDFIMSCESLAIYSQSDSMKQVQEDFMISLNILMHKWENEDVLDANLRERGLIAEVSTSIFSGMKSRLRNSLKLANMELGIKNTVDGELAYC